MLDADDGAVHCYTCECGVSQCDADSHTQQQQHGVTTQRGADDDERRRVRAVRDAAIVSQHAVIVDGVVNRDRTSSSTSVAVHREYDGCSVSAGRVFHCWKPESS